MPEGDVILRTARTLDQALAGRELVRVDSPLVALQDAGLVGRRVERVRARGKNLLIDFDDGRSLFTHMRMEGSWHVYRPGERWRKSARGARVVLENEDHVAVCFRAPVVELLAAGAEERHPKLANLGPDLLADDFDLAEAVLSLRQRGELAVGDALLDQSAVCGIGNVYKSEALFVARVDPFATIGELGDDALTRVLTAARDLMRRNLDGSPRRTRRGLDGQAHWVYRRGGEPCRQCGGRLVMRCQGVAGRSTYWCPSCQPSAAAEAPPPASP